MISIMMHEQNRTGGSSYYIGGPDPALHDEEKISIRKLEKHIISVPQMPDFSIEVMQFLIGFYLN